MADHCSDRGYKAKRLEWELVATPLEGKSWPARIVGLQTPWIFLDLADDGSVQGRMHLRQISGKIRAVIDEHG